ncbi:MAG: hypothetical protein ABFD15_06255 [Methanofastidiosum sp.]|jgi:hypothetical protein
MIGKLFERTELPVPDNKIEIFTDGNDDYTYVLPEHYDDDCINYGQLIKISALLNNSSQMKRKA